jgi:hypothetical protein
MRKRTITYCTLCLLIVPLMGIELAGANPIAQISIIPTIIVISPQTKVYNVDSLNLSFCRQGVNWGTVEFSDIKCYLDGNIIARLDVLTGINAVDAYTLNLSKLAIGQHTVEVKGTVNVKSVNYAYGGYWEILWGSTAFVSSGKINFTISKLTPNPTNAQSPIPSPTTILTPTPTPTSTPSPTQTANPSPIQQPTLEPTLAISVEPSSGWILPTALALVVVLVASGLVIFRKRRK